MATVGGLMFKLLCLLVVLIKVLGRPGLRATICHQSIALLHEGVHLLPQVLRKKYELSLI